MIADPNWGTGTIFTCDTFATISDGDLTYKITAYTSTTDGTDTICKSNISQTDTTWPSGTDTTWPEDDNHPVYYYFKEKDSPVEREKPLLPLPLAPWDMFLYSDEGQHWVPTKQLRDNRKAVWACRPRHGLSGR